MTHARSNPDPLIGRTIGGDFELIAPLGEGGMGSVYTANQRSMGRRVVVKTIRAELSGDAETVERFRRESQAVARMNHPNIVQVYAFGEMDGGGLYLVMEHVEGRTLADELARVGRMSESRTRHVGEQIAAALAAAHAAGIVHRDLKPSNVMLSALPGRADHVRVLDFGVARFTDGNGDSALTGVGVAIGTPAYMSPEQLRGKPVDGRSDLYALGLILYELIAGAHAYVASTPQEYCWHHIAEPIIPFSTRAPGVKVTASFEGLVLRCTAKDPDERFATAEAVQFALTGRNETTELPATSAMTDAAVPTLVTASVTRASGGGAAEGPSRMWLVGAVLFVMTLLTIVAIGLTWIVTVVAGDKPRPIAEVVGLVQGATDDQATGAVAIADGAEDAPTAADVEPSPVARGAGDAPSPVDHADATAPNARATGLRGEAEGPKPDEIAEVPALIPTPPQGVVIPTPPPTTPPAPSTTGWTSGPLGAPLPQGAIASFTTPTLLQYRSERPFDEVATYYERQYASQPGMMSSRTNDGAMRTCSIINAGGTTAFRMLSILADGNSTVISIFPM